MSSARISPQLRTERERIRNLLNGFNWHECDARRELVGKFGNITHKMERDLATILNFSRAAHRNRGVLYKELQEHISELRLLLPYINIVEKDE